MQTKSSNDELLSVENVRSVQGLHLLAKRMIDGISIGRHASRQKGFSSQFKEHRAYVPGDQLRALDWKLYGKTDKLYVRQYEEEINLQCIISIDCSASMNYCGSRSNGMSKWNYASAIAASLAYLVLHNQDAVGLACLGEHDETFLPPRNRANYLQEILTRLTDSKPSASERGIHHSLVTLSKRLTKRALIILLSDCFDETDSLLQVFKLMRSAGHDIIVGQVLDADEIDFPFRNSIQFQDLENLGLQQTVDCRLLATTYRENFEKHQNALRNGCSQQSIDFQSFVSDQDLSQTLRKYLVSRNAVQ